MATVVVCVGSSCHIKGSRKLIERFNDLLVKHRLEGKVELQGSFCMERCGIGMNWQIDDELFSSSSVEEALKIFNEKIITPFVNTGSNGGTD
jgi:NADH:ubiquinone oxidoreductase subunit E